MRKLLALGAVAFVAACGIPAATLISVGVSAVETLAEVAVQNNTTAASLAAHGQLFCQDKDTVFAVIGVNVTGATADYVAQACQAVDDLSVPVPAPSDPDTVPVAVQ